MPGWTSCSQTCPLAVRIACNCLIKQVARIRSLLQMPRKTRTTAPNRMHQPTPTLPPRQTLRKNPTLPLRQTAKQRPTRAQRQIPRTSRMWLLRPTPGRSRTLQPTPTLLLPRTPPNCRTLSLPMRPTTCLSSPASLATLVPTMPNVNQAIVLKVLRARSAARPAKAPVQLAFSVRRRRDRLARFTSAFQSSPACVTPARTTATAMRPAQWPIAA